MSVTEKRLQGLFEDLVADLSTKLQSGEATGKDKELVVKLLDQYNVGLTLEQGKSLDSLVSEELPFHEMHPN